MTNRRILLAAKAGKPEHLAQNLPRIKQRGIGNHPG
jgi:hypothetical protein